MNIAAACLLAVSAATLAAIPAWALSAEDVLAYNDRWRPGEGLASGSWYTYMVCDYYDGCSLYRLDFTGAGSPWNITITSAPMDFLGSTDTRDEAEITMDRLAGYYGVRWENHPSISYNTTIHLGSLDVAARDEHQRATSQMLKQTVFFIGSSVRIAHGHDPVLEVGRIWWPQGARGTDSPIVITALRAPHESCGSTIDGMAYNAAHGRAARVNTVIVDGFPFPVSGTATTPSGGQGRIAGDTNLDHTHWYELVDHSGSPGNASLGSICAMAAGFREAPEEVEPDAPTPAILPDMGGEPETVPGGLPVLTDMSIYSEGDDILVSGSIAAPLPTYPPISINITNNGGTVLATDIPHNHLNEYSSSVRVGAWDGGTYILEARYGSMVNTTSFTILGGWSAESFGDLRGITIDGFGLEARHGIVGGSVLNAFGYSDIGSIDLDIDAVSDGAALLEVPYNWAAFIGGSGLAFTAYVDGAPAPALTLYSGDDVGIMVEFAAGTTDIEITGGT